MNGVMIWRICRQMKESQAWISKYISEYIVVSNSLPMPYIPASGTRVLIFLIYRNIPQK